MFSSHLVVYHNQDSQKLQISWKHNHWQESTEQEHTTTTRTTFFSLLFCFSFYAGRLKEGKGWEWDREFTFQSSFFASDSSANTKSDPLCSEAICWTICVCSRVYASTREREGEKRKKMIHSIRRQWLFFNVFSSKTKPENPVIG